MTRALFGRRGNRRVVLRRQAFLGAAARWLCSLGRGLAVAGKLLATLAIAAGAVWAASRGVRGVVASPRFAVNEIRVSQTRHASRDELLTLAGVRIGDRLLDTDTDEVAARLTRDPWVASARARRELPGTLVLDVTEHRPAAVGVMGGLYLIDECGRAFKRATPEEARGLPALTGIARDRYATLRPAAEAAFRQALALAAEYGSHPERPRLSEIHVDAAAGWTLFLADGGAEIRLGKGLFAHKLAQLDAILEAVGREGLASVRIVHLEQAEGHGPDRIPVLLAGDEEPAPKG